MKHHEIVTAVNRELLKKMYNVNMMNQNKAEPFAETLVGKKKRPNFKARKGERERERESRREERFLQKKKKKKREEELRKFHSTLWKG